MGAGANGKKLFCPVGMVAVGGSGNPFCLFTSSMDKNICQIGCMAGSLTVVGASIVGISGASSISGTGLIISFAAWAIMSVGRVSSALLFQEEVDSGVALGKFYIVTVRP